MDSVRMAEFFQALSQELGKYTQDTSLTSDEKGVKWIQRALFATSPELENFVLTEATIFAAREDVDQLEIFVKLFPEAKTDAVAEIEKCFAELNYYSPVGAFGIHPAEGYVFLRDCFVIDGKKDVAGMVQDAIVDYELIMELVMGSYPGVSAIYSGEITFDEAIARGLLKKHSK